ncbi:MAG: hypothetical protein ABID61_00640 [Candidatus Micrarchaeota archaeon]
MELRFGQHAPKKPIERVAKPSIPMMKSITRLPIPDFDPSWVPPGALEKLKREQQPQKEDRPRLELPLYDEPPPGWQPRDESPKKERGVVIIQI